MYFSMTLPRKYRNKNYRRVNGGMIGEDCGFNSHFWPLQRFGMLTHRRGSFTGRLNVEYAIALLKGSLICRLSVSFSGYFVVRFKYKNESGKCILLECLV